MFEATYKIRAKVWLYPGAAAWHFVSIPKTQTTKIKKQFEGLTRGWGSLPVRVTIGKTTWKTSIFPDGKEGVFMLPLKADVRKKENIKPGQTISFSLEIRV